MNKKYQQDNYNLAISRLAIKLILFLGLEYEIFCYT